MQQTGNYDCPVCHNFRGDRIGQHLYAHKKKGAFTGKIDWTCKSYLRNGAVVPTSDTRKVSLKKKVVERPLIERYDDLLIQVDKMKQALSEEKARLDAQSAKIQALLAGNTGSPLTEEILK